MACQFSITQGDEAYDITLDFDRDAEQLGDVPATIDGVTGTRINSYQGMCSVSLAFVPETTPDTWDAQNIGVSVDQDFSAAGAGALDPCQVVDMAARLIVEDVR